MVFSFFCPFCAAVAQPHVIIVKSSVPICPRFVHGNVHFLVHFFPLFAYAPIATGAGFGCSSKPFCASNHAQPGVQRGAANAIRLMQR
jgi:hypothetical protein